MRQPKRLELEAVRSELESLLGPNRPADATRFEALCEAARSAMDQYRLKTTMLDDPTEERVVLGELRQIGQHADSLARLLTVAAPTKRTSGAPSQPPDGNLAVRMLPGVPPGLLRASRPGPLLHKRFNRGISREKIKALREDLIELAERSRGAERAIESDWAAQPKPKRKRGGQAGSKALKVDLAAALCHALDCAGVKPALDHKFGPEGKKGPYLKLVRWALRQTARVTKKGGRPVGDVGRIAADGLKQWKSTCSKSRPVSN